MLSLNDLKFILPALESNLEGLKQKLNILNDAGKFPEEKIRTYVNTTFNNRPLSDIYRSHMNALEVELREEIKKQILEIETTLNEVNK